MRNLLAAATIGLILGYTSTDVQRAKADDGVVAAGLAGFALGVAFPFVNGYQYHPTGYWYVGDQRHFRYPVNYYRWYAPAQGYVYVGPNWRHWYQYRQNVYAPPPYFVVPPRRYVYYPPVPYYYGYSNQPAGGYR